MTQQSYTVDAGYMRSSSVVIYGWLCRLPGGCRVKVFASTAERAADKVRRRGVQVVSVEPAIAVPHPTCQHCETRPATRRRGLCHLCYYTPSIRNAHKPRYVGRMTKDFYGLPPLPEPTNARPGTAQKIAVLQERLAANLALFHPRDAKNDN